MTTITRRAYITLEEAISYFSAIYNGHGNVAMSIVATQREFREDDIFPMTIVELRLPLPTHISEADTLQRMLDRTEQTK